MGLGVVGLQSGRFFGVPALGMHKFSSSGVRSWLFKLRLQQFQTFQFRVLGFRDFRDLRVLGQINLELE